MLMPSSTPPDALFFTGFVEPTQVALASPPHLASAHSVSDAIAPVSGDTLMGNAQSVLNFLTKFPLISLAVLTVLILLVLYCLRLRRWHKPVIGSELLSSGSMQHFATSTGSAELRGSLTDR